LVFFLIDRKFIKMKSVIESVPYKLFFSDHAVANSMLAHKGVKTADYYESYDCAIFDLVPSSPN